MAEARQRIAQRAPHQELHRQVVDALGVACVTRPGGLHPALYELVANRIRDRMQPVLGQCRFRVLAHLVHQLVRDRALESLDVARGVVVRALGAPGVASARAATDAMGMDVAATRAVTAATGASLQGEGVTSGSVEGGGLLRALETGVDDGGEWLGAKRVSLLRTGAKNAWLEIVLDEGRNRQIRRLLAAHDVSVLRLVRVRVGNLAIGDLPKGSWRKLDPREVAELGSR